MRFVATDLEVIMASEDKLFELDNSGKITSVRGVEVKPEDQVIRVLSNQELPAHHTHSSRTLTSAYEFAGRMATGLGQALDEAEPKE
jgi:hypothetical protein